MTESGGSDSSLSELSRRYGDSVELLADSGAVQTYRIAAELIVADTRYAILQTKEMQRDDEIEVFKVVSNSDGELELESVADEEEWELVAEAFDDMQFGSDERP